ncbi:hypothetical protein C0583_05920 [Candidatus Parcubacteria bacterium]|nr:MAG: hypothetical protein C0583_05920 [Candidatus Parcubacteria bacterium]
MIKNTVTSLENDFLEISTRNTGGGIKHLSFVESRKDGSQIPKHNKIINSLQILSPVIKVPNFKLENHPKTSLILDRIFEQALAKKSTLSSLSTDKRQLVAISNKTEKQKQFDHQSKGVFSRVPDFGDLRHSSWTLENKAENSCIYKYYYCRYGVELNFYINYFLLGNSLAIICLIENLQGLPIPIQFGLAISFKNQNGYNMSFSDKNGATVFFGKYKLLNLSLIDKFYLDLVDKARISLKADKQFAQGFIQIESRDNEVMLIPMLTKVTDFDTEKSMIKGYEKITASLSINFEKWED